MKRVPTVFIVDDEKRMCSSLQAILQNAGYQVDYATSGESALTFFEQKNVDLIVSDIHMPGLDGFELLETIHSRQPGTPVIMMTGDESVHSAVNALRKGAYDYLTKPFEPEDLLNTIENALQQKLLLERTRILDNRLRLSERRFRFMLKNTPDMIYTLDPDGRFKYVNESVARTFGYKAKDLIGKHYESILWDEDIRDARWRFNERRTGERATSGVTLRLKPGPQKTDDSIDGYYSVVELHATGVYRKNKKNGKTALIGTYGFIRNRKEDVAKQEGQSSIPELEEAISKVLSGIGKDLNDVLSATQSSTLRLKRKLPPVQSQLSEIGSIESNIGKGKEKVRQLLWLANGGNLEDALKDAERKVRSDIRKVIFRLKSPKARQVSLVGDFNGWDTRANPLQKDSDGLWETVLILETGRYEFKFMVDGKWRESRGDEFTVPNKYGSYNNVVVVGE
jgi:PAS domain S-box-containing protein